MKGSKLVFIIGTIISILGVIFAAVFPWTFQKEDPFMGPMGPNTTFIWIGIPMVIIGGAIAFYGRYKYTKEEEKERIDESRRYEKLVSTTDAIPGKKITKVLGEVHARNNPLATTLDGAENAKRNLEKEAKKLGANAIVGFRTERQQHKRNITYYAYGTAVIVEDEK
jgi:uncharacterized protein YbjQ (UPF0145 family)